MSTETGGEVTRLLGELGRGHKEAMNQLLPLVYDELHRLARSYFRRERGEHTLQPTALVNEAWLRLMGLSQSPRWESRAHFFGIAARLMRLVLVDYARAHRALKRGGKAECVTLDFSAETFATRCHAPPIFSPPPSLPLRV